MGSLTDYGEEAVAKHAMGLLSWAMPSTYLALFTADPGESGSTASEASGSGYARVALSGKLTWNSGAGRVENSSIIRFNSVGAGTYSHVGILDASSGGNMIAVTAIPSPETVPSTRPVEVAVGDLQFVVT